MTRDELLEELKAAVAEIVAEVEATAEPKTHPLRTEADWQLLDEELRAVAERREGH